MPQQRHRGPDGVVHTFPADATDAEIAEALESLQKPDGSPTQAEIARGRETASRIPSGTGGMAGYQALTDVATGALKGAANTAIGLGQMVHMVPGVSKAVDTVMGVPGLSQTAFKEARQAVVPTNTAQQVGYTGEQVGEFFLPLDKPAKLAKAVEVAKSGLIGTAQAGPTAGAVSAGLTAVVPGGGAAKRAAGALEESAEKSVAQALGATKEWAKSQAGKLAPQMLERGVKGSRAAMLEQAEASSRAVGERLGAAYKAAGEAGETISGQVVQGELQLGKDALMVRNAADKMEPIPGAERVIKKLDQLADFAGRMGDDIPVDKAAKIKTVWDRIVAKAGLYGPKAAANATDSADAWALREGTSSVRALLDSANPEIGALSKEYAFWKGLRDVLKATELRTQAQGGGLVSAIGASSGAATGFASGDDLSDSLTKAFVGAAAGRQFIKLVQSPYWRTSVSGPLKMSMAKALASGSTSHASGVLSQILASLPSQAKQALAQ